MDMKNPRTTATSRAAHELTPVMTVLMIVIAVLSLTIMIVAEYRHNILEQELTECQMNEYDRNEY
jgi:NADH:ubiquinone oxidoreductase subunit 5 (subunit L)/multisubunit Na+/H+ antiporter MnhA subunit